MSGLQSLETNTIFAEDFRIVRPLAEGGMGAVYVATQISTGATRALKVMLPQLVSDERQQRRFLQEARVSSKIDSDHVVQVVSAGVDKASGMPWIAMELLRGETVTELVERKGPQPPGIVREVLLQLCHAIGAAHDASIIHRDLKPDNIFLSITKRKSAGVIIKVLDFGIAKLLAESAGKTTSSVGTPLWMAPEQAQETERISPATDLWPVGLIAFYMLTGQTFWRTGHQEDSNTMAVLAEILFGELPLASHRAVELGYLGPLPEGFDDFFAKCVSREPLDRFLDAKAVAAAIEKLIPEATPLTSSMLPPALATAASHPDLTTGPTEMQLPSASEVKVARAAQTQDASSTGAVTDTNAISPTPSRFGPSEIPRQRGPGAVTIVLGLAILSIAVVVGLRFFGNPSTNTLASASASQSGAPTSAAVTTPLSPPPPAPELHCPPGTGLVSGGIGRDPITNSVTSVGSFCLDIYEVPTNDYRECVKSHQCTPPSQGPFCNFGAAGHGRHPINCVSAQQAKTFCEVQGKRLPTVIEMRWAATSGEGHSKYPWGDDDPSTQLCWSGELNRTEIGTCEGGSHPGGAGRLGIQDLEGNVAEWALASEGKIVASGSSFQSKTLEPDRFYSAKTPNQSAIGFRCATGF